MEHTCIAELIGHRVSKGRGFDVHCQCDPTIQDILQFFRAYNYTHSHKTIHT